MRFNRTRLASRASIPLFFAMSLPMLAQIAEAAPGNPTLTVATTVKPTVFRVELANPGPGDLVVNLGFTLANGAKQYTDDLRYTLTTPAGHVLRLECSDPGIIAGQIGLMIEYLPSGASFSFPVHLEKCWAPSGKVWKLDFPPGRYTLRADYSDQAIAQRKAKVDARGIPLPPLWTGTITSPPVTFEIAR
jgi:hypothetical protein